jgi:hypothetical protein
VFDAAGLERLRAEAEYDPVTGVLRWLPRPGEHAWNARCAGRSVGSADGSGYLQTGWHGRRTRVHRLAFALHHGRWPVGEIDHINGNRADNRAANLREATRSQNMANTPVRRDSRSGVKGVRRHRAGRWVASIGGSHLGVFDTPEAAHAAYCAAAKRRHGEFARGT